MPFKRLFNKLIYSPAGMDQRLLKEFESRSGCNSINNSYSGDMDRINSMIDAGAPLQARNKDGDNMLFAALSYGRKDAFEAILKTGMIDIREKDHSGDTLAHAAILRHYGWALPHLVTDPELLNGKDAEGQTPLMTAIREKCEDIAFGLIADGADIHLADNKGQTALHLALIHDQHRLIKKLIANGADIEARDNAFEGTSLYWAARYNAWQCADLLIAHKADLNSLDISGHTPLMCAAWSNSPSAAHSLLKAGANIDIRNARNETAEDIAEHMEGSIASLISEYRQKRFNSKKQQKQRLQSTLDFCDRGLPASKPLVPRRFRRKNGL